MPPTSFNAADILFLTFLCVSAASDLFYQKIYNKSIVIFLAGGVFVVVAGISETTIQSASLGLLLGFFALLPFYFVGAMGPGDVKFLAVAGWYFGPSNLLYGSLYGAALGGLGAVVILSRRGALKTTMMRAFEIMKSFLVTGGNIPPPPADSIKLPYAFFLAGGLAARVAEIKFLIP
ncbi:MAG: hypothetical protein CVU77_05870 [Elusimicrobia bacterium HGW-Elusimicrobia-1]|jgi:prepilin peptidase CpaA|nr:MAG: hypothetical protein CVU77_05870 [Elusimicrobia bacterium HGW-Elusimicrobia-1]